MNSMINTQIETREAKALDSISLMPNNIRFANQNADEQVVLFIRMHKIVLFGYLLKFFINLLIPIIVYFFFAWLAGFDSIKNMDIQIKDIYIIAAFLVWYLWSFTRFLADFLYWFYNAYIITSQRLIDLDFLSVLNHSIKELDLRNIEDAVDTHSGILQTIFDMGSVTIRTASETTNFYLNNVPKSSKVRDFIMDLSIYNGGKEK